jgi:hypothetical protein
LAEDQIITGPAVSFALKRLAELRWPRRQLPAGAVLPPRVEHQGPGYRRGNQNGKHAHGQQDHILSRERGGHGRYGQHDRNCSPQEWLVHPRRGLRGDRLAQRLLPGQPGRKVGSDRG